MNNIKEKTIFYLIFAKSKLNPKYEKHRKAREEIEAIIKELRTNENRRLSKYR